MKTKQIAEVLYEIDPMGTCCKENELFDEYEKEAHLISIGMSVADTFNACFWPESLSARQLEEIEEAIVKLL